MEQAELRQVLTDKACCLRFWAELHQTSRLKGRTHSCTAGTMALTHSLSDGQA